MIMAVYWSDKIMKYPEKDLLFFNADKDNFDGDLRIADGDFKMASSEETAKQEIMNRLKSNSPDWYKRYHICGDLEDLRGEDNTEFTAEYGKEKIINALTSDGKFKREDIRIEAVPTDINEITFYIFIDLGYEKPLVIPYVIDIE